MMSRLFAAFSGVLPDIPVTGGDAHETRSLASGLGSCPDLMNQKKSCRIRTEDGTRQQGGT
jgi:hypothetical protein